MTFPSLLVDPMTSSGVFLKSAYKTPANFSDLRRAAPLRSVLRGRVQDRAAKRLSNAIGTPVILMKAIRIGEVDHLIEADVIIDRPVPHHGKTPKDIDLGVFSCRGRSEEHTSELQSRRDL